MFRSNPERDELEEPALSASYFEAQSMRKSGRMEVDDCFPERPTVPIPDLIGKRFDRSSVVR